MREKSKQFSISGFSVCFLLAVLVLLAGIPSNLAGATKKGKVPSELNEDTKAVKVKGKIFLPKRTSPIFTGTFSVGVVLIVFSDTAMPALETVKKGLFNFGPMSVQEYFKEYSQNTTWPEMLIVGETNFPKSIYKASHPLGYYCRYDFWGNPIGYKKPEDGKERANKLRAAAKKHALSLHKSKPKKPDITCYAFATGLDGGKLEKIISPFYSKRKKSAGSTREPWEFYKPKIHWGDPLWPNSIPQVKVEGGGGTMCHELGHVLGAPDFYRAPEPNDGIGGVPSLKWAYGPTGAGYCRYIYNAYLKEVNYPTHMESGTYTLYPRKTNPAGDKPVGCFIPSAHPHYTYHLEYVKGEKAPLGNPGKKGLLIHVINRTLNSPLYGSPDLCYTYRPDDPWFRGNGNLDQALFGPTGRKEFSMSTNPSSRLPNLMDGGISISGIKETAEGVSFDLEVTSTILNSSVYKNSLLPKIQLDEVDDVLSSSFHAECTVKFRGEPLKYEYGFCWGTGKKPTAPTTKAGKSSGRHFPLYHRDRYSARVLGLKPNTKYYVRAYIRNALGTTYSKEEIEIKTLPIKTETKNIPPLLEDKFAGNWTIEQYYSSKYDPEGIYLGSSAVTTLLKLIAHYRTQLYGMPKSRKPTDYTRIHMNPSLSKPPKRMNEYKATLNEMGQTARKAGMMSAEFSKKFDKDFAKFFKLKSFGTKKVKPIQPLTEESIPEQTPHIISSLLSGKPVVVVQKPYEASPRTHGLSWVIIDGVNEQGLFHIDYPRGKDRDFKRKSGWYPLDILLKDVKSAKLIFGLTPKGF